MKFGLKPKSSRYIFLLGAVLLLLVVLSYFIGGVYRLVNPDFDLVKDAGTSIFFKDDHHFTTFETGADEATLRHNGRARLQSFGWVNKEKKIVHVPIDYAMELYLKRAIHD